jgi:hypothetical protein
MARQSGAVERLRGFPSPEVLLRMLMLHVARGYSLRETVVRAKLANWTKVWMSPCSNVCEHCPQSGNRANGGLSCMAMLLCCRPVVAVRKSDRAIQQAHRRLVRKASKKQMITRPETLRAK